MAHEPGLICFPSRAAMAAKLGDLIEAALAGAAVDAPGEIAVSGGSTPRALYEDLAGRMLPWAQIRITLVDERWVPAGHPRSNETFVRQAFNAASDAEVVGLFDGGACPQDSVEAVAKTLGVRGAPFDAVILGMGEDGHTASWFPHADGLSEALTSAAPVCAVRARKSDITGEEVDRMTLTLSAISDARFVILVITGAGKRETFEKAMMDGPVDDMPVRAILRSRPDMWVCWAP